MWASREPYFVFIGKIIQLEEWIERTSGSLLISFFRAPRVLHSIQNSSPSYSTPPTRCYTLEHPLAQTSAPKLVSKIQLLALLGFGGLTLVTLVTLMYAYLTIFKNPIDREPCGDPPATLDMYPSVGINCDHETLAHHPRSKDEEIKYLQHQIKTTRVYQARVVQRLESSSRKEQKYLITRLKDTGARLKEQSQGHSAKLEENQSIINNLLKRIDNAERLLETTAENHMRELCLLEDTYRKTQAELQEKIQSLAAERETAEMVHRGEIDALMDGLCSFQMSVIAKSIEVEAGKSQIIVQQDAYLILLSALESLEASHDQEMYDLHQIFSSTQTTTTVKDDKICVSPHMVQTAVETYHQNRQEDEETATIEADESTQASLSEDLLGSAEEPHIKLEPIPTTNASEKAEAPGGVSLGKAAQLALEIRDTCTEANQIVVNPVKDIEAERTLPSSSVLSLSEPDEPKPRGLCASIHAPRPEEYSEEKRDRGLNASIHAPRDSSPRSFEVNRDARSRINQFINKNDSVPSPRTSDTSDFYRRPNAAYSSSTHMNHVHYPSQEGGFVHASKRGGGRRGRQTKGL